VVGRDGAGGEAFGLACAAVRLSEVEV